MQVTVRANGSLAKAFGVARVFVTLPDGATVGDLFAQLQKQYPNSAESLKIAIPIIKGHHHTHDTVLHAGQEVALLIPVAGG